MQLVDSCEIPVFIRFYLFLYVIRILELKLKKYGTNLYVKLQPNRDRLALHDEIALIAAVGRWEPVTVEVVKPI